MNAKRPVLLQMHVKLLNVLLTQPPRNVAALKKL
jgi:hypothetical protein